MFEYLKITSSDNPKVKLARAVRDGRENNLIFIEGFRLADEVFKTNLKIKFVFISSKFLANSRSSELTISFAKKKIEVFELESRIFDSLADTKTSQGIIIIAEKPKIGKEVIENNLQDIPLLLLLHQINNPSNLGAILRTAEAVGVKGVISTKGTTDIFSTKTIRSAMGANFRLPIWTNVHFEDVISWSKERGIKSVCGDIRSNKSYLDIDWKIPRLLVVGSEGNGLSEKERLTTDESLIIPMENGVESLNVAVACGVILFEAKRQRNS